jgi:hypothetical protein
LIATHELKTWPVQFSDIWHRRKTCEIRKNDRGFSVGDRLRLREWSPATKTYTGREVHAEVMHIVDGQWGVPEGVCVMSILIVWVCGEDQ